MEIVTRPDKMVTDSVMLNTLLEQGIDHNYVEFYQDYAKRGIGKSPYMKGYRNLLSNKQFGVFSGLPMVDAYGFKHELIWHEKNGILENGNNIFHCIVDNGTIRLIPLSDQPNGLKKDDEGQYHPQLFIGGSEVKPGVPIPIILATDPINPNYHENVILWNYDTICRRRIRLIEGGFRERWLIDKHPHGRVRVKHNVSGKLQLNLGSAVDASGEHLKVTVIGDEEIIEASEFDNAIFPVEIGASQTFYPDAHVESTSVDGHVLRSGSNLTWADVHDGAGTSSSDSGTTTNVAIKTGGTEPGWTRIYRSPTLFDTSGLSDIANIINTVLSIRSLAKQNPLGGSPTVNIFSCNPTTNTALIAADYNIARWGAVQFSTSITYAVWSVAGYNAFTFNQAGIDAIPLDGVLKVGAREATYDAPNTAAPWAGANLELRYTTYASEQGDGFKPKLVVTYIIATPVTDGDLIGIPIIRKT